MVRKSAAAALPSDGSDATAQNPPLFAWNWSLTNVTGTAAAPAAARAAAAGRGCATTPAAAPAGLLVAVMAAIARRAAGPGRPGRDYVRFGMFLFPSPFCPARCPECP